VDFLDKSLFAGLGRSGGSSHHEKAMEDMLLGALHSSPRVSWRPLSSTSASTTTSTTTTTTTAPPTTDPTDYFMSDEIYDNLDLIRQLGIADEEEQRVHLIGRPVENEDYMSALDNVFDELHLDTATHEERAQGTNTDYMDDSIFDLLKHEKLAR
jgi:hypothetical protein